MIKPIKHVLKGMPTGFYYPSEVDPYIKHLEQRAEAAEAKLAGLAKQKPAGKFVFEPMGERWHHIKHGEAQHAEPKLSLVKLYARPAPAADLAELVPEEMTPDMMKAVQCNSELGAYAAANLAGAYDLFDEFWKVARGTMLRNIEEQSK